MKHLIYLMLIGFSFSVHAKKFNFVAIGDAPYIKPTGYNMFEQLIAEVNNLKPDFVIHVGDIKGGSQACADSIYNEVYDLFNKFNSPLLYTPGDNEWTDCHRATAGAMDPIERLSFIRKKFFAKPQSLGKKKINFISQSRDKKYSKFVENYYFEHESGIVASVHVVGSNNNLNPANEAATKEFLERQVANLAWMDEVLKKAEKAKFLILFFHAEIGWGKSDDKFKGYDAFYNKIVKYAESVNTPTLMIHGDDHQFKIDHPIYFVDAKTGLFSRRPHLTRVEVYGFPDVRTLEVTVDTARPQPFSFYSHAPIAWQYKKGEL